MLINSITAASKLIVVFLREVDPVLIDGCGDGSVDLVPAGEG